jgi:uncharacterized protein (DUF433 family)
MTLALEPTTAVPLRTDPNGVIRVGQSRVTLETLLHSWQQGSSPEEIVEAFPVLRLDDVYAVIAYVLRHEEDMKTYLQESKLEQGQALENIKVWFPNADFRARVLARAAAKGLR